MPEELTIVIDDGDKEEDTGIEASIPTILTTFSIVPPT